MKTSFNSVATQLELGKEQSPSEFYKGYETKHS